MATFETDTKDYEKKIKDGAKVVADANLRFGNWYYVIDGESFEGLKLSRKDLVKQKPLDPKTFNEIPSLDNLNTPKQPKK